MKDEDDDKLDERRSPAKPKKPKGLREDKTMEEEADIEEGMGLT